MNCARQTRTRTSQGFVRLDKRRFLSNGACGYGFEEVKPKPKRNWIQEERRKTLGDYTCFCLQCGSVWRYFLEREADLPAACPHCGGETRHRCPECSAPFPSAFAVECEECSCPSAHGGARRAIRKPGR